MGQFLILNDLKYSFNKLPEISPKSRFEEETIGFIQDWQAGNESFLQNTSGSTGTPKLIEITRSQMMASAMMTIKALDLKQNQNCLLCLSPEYIGGKMMLVRALINKMNIVAVEPSSNPLDNVSQPIDFAAMTPMQLQSILKDPSSARKVGQFGVVILGGGPVSPTLHQKTQKLAAKCYATYGMTETVSHIALKKLNGPDRSNYYKCLEGIEINLDDRGCLTISGAPTNFNTVTTNDLVHLINDCQFDWLGRIDNVINTGGVKIQCEKVEKVVASQLGKLALANRIFVAGVADDKFGEVVTLFIEGKLSPSAKQTIKTNISKELAKFEVPKNINSVSEFIETPTGKIDRKKTIQKALNTSK